MSSSVTSYFRLIVNTLQNVVKIMFSGAGAESGAGVGAGSIGKKSLGAGAGSASKQDGSETLKCILCVKIKNINLDLQPT